MTHATSTGIVGVQLERAKASEARHPVGEPLVRSYDEEHTIVPVAGWGIEILTTSLPRAKLGQPYSAMLTADREVESWSVVSGSLPDGLSLSPVAGDRRAATISGTPSKWALGTHVFIVRA
ncbi:MAG: hypothetical protein IJR14_10925, partial [Synergistaceae bacterium]|nr:hypothetical protein [Synergistaceae bacterium]